jgi:hypothetical protein
MTGWERHYAWRDIVMRHITGRDPHGSRPFVSQGGVWPTVKGPATSRGRAKHVIGVVVVTDSVPLELLVAQAVFGPPVRPIADIMGVAEDSPYDVVLVGEERRHVLPRGIDMGELAPLGTPLREVDTVIVPGISEPLSRRSDDLLGSLSAASESGARMVWSVSARRRPCAATSRRRSAPPRAPTTARSRTRVDMPSASFRTDPDDLDATDGEELRGGAGWSNGHL